MSAKCITCQTDSFDYDLLFQTLQSLKKGNKVDVPIYDFVTHSRLNKTKTVYGANVVIFEGIFALYDKRVRDIMDMKLFVDTDADIRLARRCKIPVLFVKPAYDDHIHPTMRYADVIIPRGLDNTAAIDVITRHISRQLNDRGLSLRIEIPKGGVSDKLPDSLIVLKPKPQLKALHTAIRDRTTSRHDFIFFAERLSRMVVERGLAELPFDDVDILTPTKSRYAGKTWAKKVCGVSVVRAGATMEQGLRSVVKDIPIGKILIQTDPSTGEPQLHYCKLPADIRDRYVLISDAQVATGAAALMAIRVILDHDVPEDHIIFLTLIAAPLGVHTIAKAFPAVHIVASEIDKELDDKLHIVPGFGNFGDRYFGTTEESFPDVAYADD
ncbi:Uridine-cytidine kinase-like 1 [Rhizophlyctis rosea]|nr:Uridine-cytidine kinase-like 1 [Rhizophlyctis rosea]